jgi:hypothetical protein
MQSIKFINGVMHTASVYMNTKLRLLNYNANIYFNRMCSEQNLTSKYVYTKVNSHNKFMTKRLQDQTHKLRIKNEIKFGTPRNEHLTKHYTTYT